MKWSDLTLKERKQIYDAVRAENPNASYFDIKSQFDLIPEYEDGKDGESNYKTHTPEENSWVARRTVELGLEGKPVSQDSLYTIVDRARVQNKPGTHDLKWYEPRPGTKEQAQQFLSGLNKTVGTAATAASLLTMSGWNLLRFLNVGKGTPYRLWAAKNASAGAKAGAAADVMQFAEDPTIDNALEVGLSAYPLGPKGYLNPSTKVTGLLESAADIKDLVPAYQDGKGKTKQESIPIQLDPQQYVPGTGSHELSHVVDQLAGDVIKNRYLNFLADSDNIMSVPELEKKGIRIPPKIQFYLSDPQEAKAHMIQLKHAMLNSGKINNWSQKVTQQELEDFLFDPLNTQLTGSMNKLQYKMYRNKSRFSDRFNRVNPLAIGAPIGLAATNNKDKQSN